MYYCTSQLLPYGNVGVITRSIQLITSLQFVGVVRDVFVLLKVMFQQRNKERPRFVRLNNTHRIVLYT